MVENKSFFAADGMVWVFIWLSCRAKDTECKWVSGKSAKHANKLIQSETYWIGQFLLGIPRIESEIGCKKISLEKLVQ